MKASELSAIPSLAQAMDRQVLSELVVRYARGIDRWDVALVQSCFFDDAQLSYNAYRGPSRDFFDRLFDPTVGIGAPIGGLHVISNVSLELNGDIAYGESYLAAIRAGVGLSSHAYSAESPGVGFPVERFGRYIDQFERRHGEWRISSRIVIMEWLPEEEDTYFEGENGYRLVNFTEGNRDRSDPSYMRSEER